MKQLAVWLEGTRIGMFDRRGAVSRFTFAPEAFALGVGSPLMSVAMPVRRAAYTGSVVDAFFDGLLPEGEALKMLAYDFGVDATDAFGLLAQLGRDCAGALQILPDDSAPEAAGGTLEPLDDAQVAERIRRLKTHPLGVDGRVRISLAGVQDKLVLARRDVGWALPQDGAPSTHILKPAHPFLPHTIANEALCLAVARHAGVATTDARVKTFGGREVLVITRFDRSHDAGATQRIHLEDMCQATGTSPRHKYEEDGGPSLQVCARILREWGDGADNLERMLDITTINVAIGNADAHGKNLSLLHTPAGGIELAPAYDLLCTRLYDQPDRIAGMFVNGVRDIDEMSAEDLIREAMSWGLPLPRASARVTRLLDALPHAIDAAARDVDAPPELVELIGARVRRLAGA